MSRFFLVAFAPIPAPGTSLENRSYIKRLLSPTFRPLKFQILDLKLHFGGARHSKGTASLLAAQIAVKARGRGRPWMWRERGRTHGLRPRAGASKIAANS
jgi:hypothetical protein